MFPEIAEFMERLAALEELHALNAGVGYTTQRPPQQPATPTWSDAIAFAQNAYKPPKSVRQQFREFLDLD